MTQAESQSSNAGPGYAAHPSYRIDFEPCPKRIRAVFNGETIADSSRARLLLETAHSPVYYFPREDVRLDLAQRTEHGSHCPFKGDACYWTLAVAERSAENAIWSYEAPFNEVLAIKDYVALYWDKLDHWYEADEEIFDHARAPDTPNTKER
jgi:uncharacterized protein (DUF427 family)